MNKYLKETKNTAIFAHKMKNKTKRWTIYVHIYNMLFEYFYFLIQKM